MHDSLMALLTLATLVLLPVIPAILIFKVLPTSSAEVSGPFQGLRLKLGGAFSAYFVVVLLVVTAHSVWNPIPNEKIWTVTGNLVTPAGTPFPAVQASDISIEPQNVYVDPGGRFTITITSTIVANTPRYPTLRITHQDYYATVPLDPNDKQQQWSTTTQQINIPSVLLTQLPPYLAEGTPPAPVAAPVAGRP